MSKKSNKSYLERYKKQQRQHRKAQAGTTGSSNGYVLSNQSREEMIEKLRSLGFTAEANKLALETGTPENEPEPVVVKPKSLPIEGDRKNGVKVYGLFEGNQCRYVGQTRTKVAKRMAFHWKRAHENEQTRVANWLRSCVRRGISVQIKVLLSDAIWHIDEIKMIKQMHDQGHSLLNMTSGGDFEANMRESKFDERLKKYGLTKADVFIP